MQPNPQDRINTKRFRIDAFASRAVTFFGLLVLAMFFLLILHMLGNALPLLKTPHLTFQQSYSLNDDALLSVHQLGDDVLGFSRKNCLVDVRTLKSEGLVTSAQFNHPCTSRFVSVQSTQGYDAFYGMIREDGLFELYSLDNLSSQIARSLIGSFSIKAILESENVKSKGALQNATWHLQKQGDNLVLYTMFNASMTEKQLGQVDNENQVQTPLPSAGGQLTNRQDNSALLIWHTLNSLDAPSLTRIEQLTHIVPLVRFKQAILVNKEGLSLVNHIGERMQMLEANSDAVNSIQISPNQRTVYLAYSKGRTEVLRSANVEGEFLLTRAAYLEGLENRFLNHLVFDRQTLVAAGVDNQGQVHLFNSASNELVNTQALKLKPQFLHWHDQALYIIEQNKVHQYTLQNAAGITTWKSLFEPVQYSGYQSPEYIWQTSQSAEYAEPKFSLVPLIIGSLKASLLALLVAIPLALGSAIYTAYFANSRVRSVIKPSIEMIEAIPSVIIGFIAAVWLAPFAERSLFALLVSIVCLPVIVMLMAAFNAYIKRSDVYAVIKPYYLFILSSIFLLLLLSVFHSTSAIQASVMDAQHTWLGQFMANLTITKTTVVVALALGIAVAPTIYSLVDDALFEVPEGVKQASFALGATELQTLSRVVLVVALPSIISAIMLGLGRAFGETMIVLMVTGNTPIADWDLLSGLRSLTSNLTIELQESSVGTAHYHILFLTAAILFAFTFAINTVASLLKRRLQSETTDA